MPDTILTPDQIAVFEDRGVVRLPGFYPKPDIDRMADRLWNDLETRYGIRRHRPETWTVVHPAQFQAVTRSGAFAAIGSPELCALADALLGLGQWERPRYWGAPLVTFPTPVPTPPHPAWHLDIGGAERFDQLPTLRVFTFLEPLLPHGGGTLYVAGSHRFAIDMDRENRTPLKSAQVRDRLRTEYQWFATLLDTPLADLRPLMGVKARVGPYTVSVEEMTGAAGDLIIMHSGILHGIAHNALTRPRLMLREWIPRRPPPAHNVLSKSSRRQ